MKTSRQVRLAASLLASHANGKRGLAYLARSE
jgi:hypothetical protein